MNKEQWDAINGPSIQSIIDNEYQGHSNIPLLLGIFRRVVDYEIDSNTEWLETTEGDGVECVGVENLSGILDRRLAELEKLIQHQ